MSGPNTVDQIPSRYDLLVDGYGYVFWSGLMQSLPFRNQRAAYSHTPTFIERTNVSGAYGDNQQDFFLTASQNNWTGGEGQRFLHLNVPDEAARYWDSVAISADVEGQFAPGPATTTVATTYGVVASLGLGVFQGNSIGFIDTNAHLQTIGQVGTVTDQGAHGAGTSLQNGLAVDSQHLYIAGATKIRKWDGGVFSDFSAQANAGSLAFLNNQLYSCDGATLRVYDTSGGASTLFIWKTATGTNASSSTAKIIPFGGDLLILFFRGNSGAQPELWLYDGTSTYKIADYPAGSTARDVYVVDGVVFVSGCILDATAKATISAVPIIWRYLNGNLDEHWRGSELGTLGVDLGLYQPALGSYQGRLIFTDSSRTQIMQANVITGAISSIGGTYSIGGSATTDPVMLAQCPAFSLLSFNHSGASHYILPASSTALAATSSVSTSLIDFDNSLTKIFRGVKIDWDGGGTVDVAYQLDSLDGSYTTLQAGVTSGTENLFAANTAGHSVSIKITLNSSTGNIPIVKRMYVRAAPVQQTYRRCQYVLDLTGRSDVGTPDPVPLRDGTYSTLTGAEMAANLTASITSTTPVTIKDRFGTYTAVFEQGEGITEIDEVRPAEFVAQVTAREV